MSRSAGGSGHEVVHMGPGRREEQRRLSGVLRQLHTGTGPSAAADRLGIAIPADHKGPLWKSPHDVPRPQPIELITSGTPPELLQFDKITLENARVNQLSGRLDICSDTAGALTIGSHVELTPQPLPGHAPAEATGILAIKQLVDV